MKVLVLNSGSSSLKFQLIATDLDRIKKNHDERLCRGQIERIGGEAIITAQTPKGLKQKFTASLPDLFASLEYLVHWIDDAGLTHGRAVTDIDAIGHRVVHGGELFAESTLITDEVLKGIEECIDLAPLHNPNNIKGILAARRVFGPRVPQVAVFDTAFHQSIPEQAYLYAVPYHLYRRHHVRRFGFHGTSHRFVSDKYAALRGLGKEQTNVITVHLGNGCSAAAIRRGRSVDTSMGMTPLEGLVMGTRSGDVDPAIVSLIATKEGLSAQEAEALLNTQSGLLGISGLTNDMRDLLREVQDHGDRRARLAIDIFCYRTRKYVGAFLACMGGADAVVFTGGIGENQPEIRANICEGLEWAGLRIDHRKNEQAAGVEGQISTNDSTLHAFVIPTDEELLIARDTVRCIEGGLHSSEMERPEKVGEQAADEHRKLDVAVKLTEPQMKATQLLHNLGQSIWLDNITRDLLDKGTLKIYIDELSLTGLTSNPTIFNHAVKNSSAYDATIRKKSAEGKSGDELFFELALEDLTRAADLFRPVYDRTNGVDGWVSLEVSPLLAYDTAKSLEAAKALHARAARPNLLIKIPGTKEGLPAIEEAIFSGIPINVTLLFSSDHYLAAAEAFLRGVERRMAAGLKPSVGSVASVFISRWDAAASGKVPSKLEHKLGIAIAMRTYREARNFLTSPRWHRIYNAGAFPQRLLWASTGTKDPAASDVLYVKSLAAPFTVNTMPEATLKALAAHKELGSILPADGGDCEEVLAQFTEAGIDIDGLAAQLQKEGAKSFVKSWEELMSVIESKTGGLRAAS
jgi:acetate kinase/transaldolase